MITCNRCGKENQDHYKFCLGCGNDIRALVAAAKAAAETPPEPAASPIATSPTERPPEPAPAKKGGIPWGDSPKMPAPLNIAKAAEQLGKPVSWSDPTPVPPLAEPALAPAAPSVEPSPTELPIQPFGASIGLTVQPQVMRLPALPVSGAEAPRATATGAPALQPASPAIDLGASPQPVAPVHAVAPLTTPAPVVHTPMPLAVPPMSPSNAPDICPACNKPIIPGFAFCGVCGTRLNVAPTGPQKTMFMAAPQPAAVPVPQWHLVVIRPDGSEGGSLTLKSGGNPIGRGQGTLFDADLYLSPRHAEFVVGADGLLVRDTQSLNGVFVKISQPEPLQPGDIFRVGQELIRFDVIAPPGPLEDGTEVAGTPNPGYWGRLTVIVGRDLDGAAFPLFGESMGIGRERGEVVFPDDGYVSGSHARIAVQEGTAELTDLGSSNGTFLRIRGERSVSSGTFVLMGQQLFRIEYR